MSLKSGIESFEGIMYEWKNLAKNSDKMGGCGIYS
jgi:hypothetical protein